MLKTTVKIFLMFVLVVLVAVVTGLTTYNVTKKLTAETPADAAHSASTDTVPQETESREPSFRRESNEPHSNPEYYTVRLEGTTLGVYVSYDGKEEFLYHENVYKNDLSADDIQMLQKGVNLPSMSELTGFLENFTS